jgi:hypothetical protein
MDVPYSVKWMNVYAWYIIDGSAESEARLRYGRYRNFQKERMRKEGSLLPLVQGSLFFL